MTTSPTISFYNGIGTIGGTKIAVSEGGYRVIFDFGLTFAPGGDFWGGKVHPRDGAARLRDLVALGYTPALDGIYRSPDAQSLGLTPGGDGKTHVFISHLHLDHMALVDLLADDVPVWMHTDSLQLFRACAATGEQPPVPVGAQAFEWGQSIQVGPMTVTPLAVDHDIPGASGLLIQTSAGTVLYTGDLRRHGPHPERVDEFIRAARATEPKILLIEGTRLTDFEPGQERPVSVPETAVPERIGELLRGCPGLALITLYPRNTVRNNNLVQTAREAGRLMLFSPEAAYMQMAMGADLAQSGIYLPARCKEALANGRAESWLTEVMGSGAPVFDAAAVRQEPARFLLQLFYWDLPELVDLQPPQGSSFIHSNGEPLGRYDPAFELFSRWIEKFGLQLVFVASTGHASHEHLIEIVEGIKPALLMPIHSRTPELMVVEGQPRELPETGATYEIVTGKRVG
jgi:ribonuclease J